MIGNNQFFINNEYLKFCTNIKASRMFSIIEGKNNFILKCNEKVISINCRDCVFLVVQNLTSTSDEPLISHYLSVFKTFYILIPHFRKPFNFKTSYLW